MEKELEKLKKLLLDNPEYTMAYTVQTRTFCSKSRGIAPLIALKDRGVCLRDAFVADRIVGRAAALLYVSLDATKLYAPVAERRAKDIFSAHKITLYSDETIEKIINHRGDGECPMNLAAEGITDPDEAYKTLKAAVGDTVALVEEL